MRFKDWFAQFLEDLIPGTQVGTFTKDITNTNMGVASRYQGPGETGERAANHTKTKIANFGQDSPNRKTKAAFWRNIHVSKSKPSDYFPT